MSDTLSRADVRAGARRQLQPTRTKDQTSSLVTLLATVSPVLMATDNTTSLPEATTWFPIKRGVADTTQSARKRKRLGQAKRKRDRIRQELDIAERNDRKLQSKLTATNKRIAELRGAQVRRPTAKEVYEVLEKNYSECPWPVPPSSILMHLPVQEDKEAGLTSEAILRRIIGADKRARHCFQWEIRNVEVRPEWT